MEPCLRLRTELVDELGSDASAIKDPLLERTVTLGPTGVAMVPRLTFTTAYFKHNPDRMRALVIALPQLARWPQNAQEERYIDISSSTRVPASSTRTGSRVTPS